MDIERVVASLRGEWWTRLWGGPPCGEPYDLRAFSIVVLFDRRAMCALAPLPSYCWSPAERSIPIWIDGNVIKIKLPKENHHLRIKNLVAKCIHCVHIDSRMPSCTVPKWTGLCCVPVHAICANQLIFLIQYTFLLVEEGKWANQ